MSRGAIGIILSHLSVLQDAYDAGYETIWVMEDDIELLGNPHSVSDLISELEPFDRGRYAGPVGWIGADGDGEWAIALRGAQLEGNTVRAFAGCGIVAESDADSEAAETDLKFQPIIQALTS